MKKLSLAVLLSMVLAACTADVYSTEGNATILNSKDISKNVVELTVQKDSGEIIKLTRDYDSHAAVGARVYVADKDNNKDSDLITIDRYEFK